MTTTAESLHLYLTRYPKEMVSAAEDPEAVVDRYFTPDYMFLSDGVAQDRRRLLAHARAVRRKAPETDLEVQETVVEGRRVSARYTVRATINGRRMDTEIYMFGEMADDGRLSRLDQITRVLKRPTE
ncbi:SnoaL-like protein [Nocardiopsis sp. Huas11]|uniref:nuclear transport factor 2 family protein n=1 Tax=Nocardiopsis sp. Huas11 TaxID=2183912 RepID=UPI000F106F9B|nr:nuclear transport factor 2 family protein [Nocardiopsis sp. Huas11]RKS05536.1 SnoaL-like protein [Nocardiopsis sp. Huas11]